MRDKLIAVLTQKIGKNRFTIGSGDEPVITFPAAHSAVGDLQIWDDGFEATVTIGEITHGHFSCFEEGLTQNETEQHIVESVAEFVEDMLADRFLLWSAKDRASGGWQHIDFTSESPLLSCLKQDAVDYYLWSGPTSPVE
jgi:hypothetical protein